ncbi:MAG TPA: YfhO family protein [Nitrospirota bacterium]|nr:YfhO family protein [Nitrospirota bacterium]
MANPPGEEIVVNDNSHDNMDIRINDTTQSQKGNPKHALLLAHAVMASVLVVFFAPAVFSSAQFVYLDTGRLFEPMKRYISQELLHGRFPAWNPYSGLGVPIVAGAIDSAQHPFNLLLLPSLDLGFKLWILLMYFIAMAGGFAWARCLGRSWYASIGAGLAFGISGFLVSESSNLQFLSAYATLPLVFAVAHAWFIHGTPSRLALLCLASALCASAGDPQSWGFVVLMLPFYAIFAAGPKEGRPRAAARGLIALLASVVSAAPFYLPVFAWLPHTSRNMALLPLDYEKWNLHAFRLAEFIVPHVFRGDPGSLANPLYQLYAGNEWTPYPWALSIYLGAVCFTLAVTGAFRARSARWMLVIAALFAWMAMGANGGFWEIAGQIPILRSFRYWEKMAIWTTLFVSMASAFGIDAVADDRHLAKRLAVLAGTASVVSFLVAASLALAPDAASQLVLRGNNQALAEALVMNLFKGFLHVALASVPLGLVSYSISRNWIPRASRAALVFVLIVDVALANRGAFYLSDNLHWSPPPLASALNQEDGIQRTIVPFGPQIDRWPSLDTFERMYRWFAHTLDAPWNVPSHVGNFRPYEGMIQDRMYRYELATNFTPMIGAGLWGVSSAIVPDKPDAAAQVKVPPPYRVLGTDAELPAYAVEIPHRPRAYLAKKLMEADDKGALMFALEPNAISSGFVVLESSVPTDYAPSYGDAKIIQDEPEHTALETRSDHRALLVLNDAYAPGWTVSVDGHASEILPANYLARGVWVEAGTHSVVFEYHTPLLRAGWGLFIAGAAAIGIWTLARRRR